MAVPIITRDTNIVKNTVFEPVLRKDSIFSIYFAIISQKSVGRNSILTKDIHRYAIVEICLPFIWKSCGGLNHHQR